MNYRQFENPKIEGDTALMSELFDDLAALDRKIANRWKIRTRDNVRHVLSAADIDFIFADVIKSAHTTDITEKQGSAIIMLLNASMAANAAKSDAALDRIIHYWSLHNLGDVTAFKKGPNQDRAFRHSF